jgi:prevent-host-death family protein
MKKANIAIAKNQFSRLIKLVKRGQPVLITERDHPVACLQPVAESEPILARLHAMGVLNPPQTAAFDWKAFRKQPRPRLPARESLAAAVVAERSETR